MPRDSLPDAAARYVRDGFLSPVDIVSYEEPVEHRARMEEAEANIGTLHYKAKVHTILRSPCELATHSRVLDVRDLYRQGTGFCFAHELAPSGSNWGSSAGLT